MVLTKRNSDALATLLQSDEDYDLFNTFARDHAGATIRFDAVIADLSLHDGSATRYDVLLFAGDSPTTGVTGPNFHFDNVNIVADLHLTGDVPDTLKIGQQVRVTAKVLHFSVKRALFELEPVTTRIR